MSRPTWPLPSGDALRACSIALLIARVASTKPTLNGFPAEPRPRPSTQFSRGALRSTRQAAVFVPPVSTAKNNSTSADVDVDFITSILLDMGDQRTLARLLRR